NAGVPGVLYMVTSLRATVPGMRLGRNGTGIPRSGRRSRRRSSSPSSPRLEDKPMQPAGHPSEPEVFISYDSRDRERVVQIARQLKEAGVTVWRDQEQILGGQNYGPRIVQGIKHCKVLLLMCTDAALRSKNVKQEIQLAWHYDRPYLPL